MKRTAEEWLELALSLERLAKARDTQDLEWVRLVDLQRQYEEEAALAEVEERAAPRLALPWEAETKAKADGEQRAKYRQPRVSEPGEIWRDVVGYEGFYQVSNLGRVYSMPRTITKKSGTTANVGGRFIHGQQPTGPHDHRYITLSKNVAAGGVGGLTYSVADLVLEAFIGLPVLPEHKDGNSSNCALDNLVLRPPSARMSILRKRLRNLPVARQTVVSDRNIVLNRLAAAEKSREHRNGHPVQRTAVASNGVARKPSRRPDHRPRHWVRPMVFDGICYRQSRDDTLDVRDLGHG